MRAKEKGMCSQVQVQLYDLCHDIVGSIIRVVVVWGSRASNLDNSVHCTRTPIVLKNHHIIKEHHQSKTTMICNRCYLHFKVPTKAPFNW